MKAMIHSGLAPCCLATLVCLAAPLAGQVPHLLHHQGRVAVDGVNFDGSGQFKFVLTDGGTNVSRQATAVPVINSGFITSVTVTDGGSGYDPGSPPAITVNASSGSGVVLVPVITGGMVAAITVSSPGAAYAPDSVVVIGGPPPSIVYQRLWGNHTAGADGIEPVEAVTLPVVNGLFEVLLGDSSLANMATVPASVFGHPDVGLRVWFNDGSHGFQQLVPDRRIAAVGYALIAEGVPDGAITAGKIAPGVVGDTELAAGAVHSSHIAGGAVGSLQLAGSAVQGSHVAAGAISSEKIATGAVGSQQIAAGAITAAELAKPPRSGSIDSASLQIDFNRASFVVSLAPGFSTTPVITLGCEGAFSGGVVPSVWVESSNPASFSGRFSAAIELLTVDSTGDVGAFSSLLGEGRPAISYYDGTNHELKFVRAPDPPSFTIQWIALEP